MNDTLKEQGRSFSAETVRLFTYVLHYDELAKPRTLTFRLEAPRVVVKRGEGGTAPAWQPSSGELMQADGHTSREHVTLEKRGGVTVAVDSGSSNGTFINGQRLNGEAVLADGDLVQVGYALWSYREVPKTLLRGLDAPPPGVDRSYCPEVAELQRLLALIAPSKEPVLVIAETGSGKELIANTVHRLSGRKGELVAVDCGAVPESLFESTFFGHEKGAYTGATEAREGEVLRANKGTLFLDEVGNLAVPSQAKLLRVLEVSQVSRLGGRGPQPVDVRWVAATNAQLFDDQGFRSDLVHRLAGFVARLPPLRKRREDLGLLTARFLEELGVTSASISAPAARVLFSHPFPGNVRQLRATLRSAALLARADSKPGQLELDLPHFPELSRPAVAGASASGAAQAEVEAQGDIKPRARPPTSEELMKVLDETGGNVSQAAKRLQTYPRQLYRWLEQMPEVLEKYRK
ncbi:MAG: sigma-54-dependent Fis family transcriptional regulator [Myxococcaceae bacterium]|nr:sigma-54-dependent Fis family transcriptional regulator [Myxococcaceae bacterium]